MQLRLTKAATAFHNILNDLILVGDAVRLVVQTACLAGAP